MDQPYLVDINGYIMYLDQALLMWAEIEAREDLIDNEVTSFSRISLGNSDNVDNAPIPTAKVEGKKEITSKVKSIKDRLAGMYSEILHLIL